MNKNFPTFKVARDAISARLNGRFDDPALLRLGPLHTNIEIDVRRIKREYLVETLGFQIGPRDPQRRPDVSGKFMALENRTDITTRFEGGPNGPWCMVGDDEDALIDEAFVIGVMFYAI